MAESIPLRLGGINQSGAGFTPPVAEAEIDGPWHRQVADLNTYARYRVIVGVYARGIDNCDVNIEYSTDNVTWADLNATAGQGEVTIDATGLRVGAWVNIAAAAKAKGIYLRAVVKDGDGVEPVALLSIVVQLQL